MAWPSLTPTRKLQRKTTIATKPQTSILTFLRAVSRRTEAAMKVAIKPGMRLT
ncbi:hypothetical protein D3C87_1978800 [compost metagenome]